MPVIKRLYQRFRLFKYRWLSDKQTQLTGLPDLRQPLLVKGDGRIHLEDSVQIGYESSAGYWNTYTYMDVRNNGSIVLNHRVILNNNASLTADHSSIEIGENTLAGIQLTISTGDGHSLEPNLRHDGMHENTPVRIGSNVFIGDFVTILKGVTIGDGCVIGSNSVVTSDIPENTIAAGNPCKIIRPLSR